MKISCVIAAWLLAATLAWAALADEAPTSGKDEAALLAGVSQIAAPGVPGPLCVFGGKAVVVVAGGAGKEVREPVVAAGPMGAGRVVAFGHPGYLEAGALAVGDTGKFMLNAIRWAAGAGTAPRVAVYKQRELVAFLGKQGVAATALEGEGWQDKLKSFDVFCVSPAALTDDASLAAVSKFVSAGGGLIAADLGWGWLQLHPGKNLLADHPGNRLLAPAGIVWGDGTVERTAASGFTAGEAPSPLTHAARALDALLAQAEGKSPMTAAEVAQAGRTVTSAARSIPPQDALFLPRLRRIQEERAAGAIPTREKPLKADRPLDRLALTLQLDDLKRLAPESIRAHPAAAAFPGAVPADAPRVERTVNINVGVPGWHSTGLYAPPGSIITVTAAEVRAEQKIALRIGSHSDGLWALDSWPRCPEVCTRTLIEKPVTRAAGAFGGLIYIDVPAFGMAENLAVKIAGAVEAPHYVLGKTSLAEWREKVRLRPAPWAELETGKVILTVPSSAVRRLDDPEDLMKFWDSVLDCCAELAGIPLERRRPERYVCDVQISAGYMHSGYPIMTLLDMPDVMVDKRRMMANGHGGVWGLWHEMGHNHQQGDWTFGGTGEVTENLFTLYVFDKVCGRPKSAMERASGPRIDKQVKAYIAAGADFEKWKADPFLALRMYVQLQEAFGWNAFKKVFAEYRGLSRGARPKNDDEKRDQWMVRFSRAVGCNLGPFFQAWGVPTSEKARASIADLPAWMPEGFPPK
jgi:hypothetical protein